MTRRDFELIAAVIRSSEAVEAAHEHGTTADTRRELASEFAGALMATNPRFDVARFIEAATGSER